ncbi:HNH endonuclease [Hirschia maritima]|uniref:HNH endonuclease n=1 Tax=Hirschia maritima TaxID=1121961 RepID=UPI002D21C15C|nr:HNH endonuclease [Hirschia maritima]
MPATKHSISCLCASWVEHTCRANSIALANTTHRHPLPSAWFQELWASQSGKCALCGEAMPRTRFKTPHSNVWKKLRPTFDHIWPISKNGKDELSNLQLVHADCNKRKGNST